MGKKPAISKVCLLPESGWLVLFHPWLTGVVACVWCGAAGVVWLVCPTQAE
jgi:hypothetical protein